MAAKSIHTKVVSKACLAGSTYANGFDLLAIVLDSLELLRPSNLLRRVYGFFVA
jgi:hypothetical protein